MKVALGSRNRPKREAVEGALAAVWPQREFELIELSVQSRVSEQPMSEQETLEGAYNRAIAALMAAPRADLAVGIEGGLCDSPLGRMESTWVCVLGATGRIGYASTIRMMLPPSFEKLIQEGKDLSQAAGPYFGIEDIGQQQGFFGAATNGALTRASAYKDAVAAALFPFLHPELFEPDDVRITLSEQARARILEARARREGPDSAEV